VAEEVHHAAGEGDGVAWEALDQRPCRRIGRVGPGELRRQTADRDTAASLGARTGARVASGAAAARRARSKEAGRPALCPGCERG
jgi:hypothetical protein